MGKKFPTPVISKFIIACLIIVALIGAALSIYISYQPKSQTASEQNLVATEEDADTAETATDATASDEVSTEISELDKAINSVDDETLSDSDLEL